MAYSNSYQRSRVDKWWKPANDEQKKLFDRAKDDVLCYLTINKEGVSARQLFKKMKEEECEIDYKKMGFNRFAEFLYHIDDILSVKTGAVTNDLYLFLKSSAGWHEDISHITALVKETPGSRKSGYKGFKAKQSNTRYVPSSDLLTINCEPRPDGPPPSSSASFAARSRTLPRSRSSSSSLRGNRRSGSSGRPLGARERQARLMSSRSHSVPALRPLNPAAQTLQASTAAPAAHLPVLKPLNAAAQNLQSQQQLKPVFKPIVPVYKPPTLRTIHPGHSNLSNSSSAASSTSSSTWKPNPIVRMNPQTSAWKPPVLKPLSEIRKINSGILPKPMAMNNSNNDNNGQEEVKVLRNPVLQLKPISQIMRNNTGTNSTANNGNAAPTTSNNNNNTNPNFTQVANSTNVEQMMTNATALNYDNECDVNSNEEEAGSDRDSDFTDEEDDVEGEQEFAWDENQENMDVDVAGQRNHLSPIRETEDELDGNSSTAPKDCLKSTPTCSSTNQGPPSMATTSSPAPPPRLIGTLGSPRRRFQSGLTTISTNIHPTFGNPGGIKSEPTNSEQPVHALSNSNNINIKANIKVEVKTEENKIERFKKEVFSPEGLRTPADSRATSCFSYESYRLESMKREAEASPQSTTSLPSSSGSTTSVLKKKIYKTLKQSAMNLGLNETFSATLVGCDQFGYMFVHLENPVIKESFRTFHKEIQDFYNDSMHQTEYRMEPGEIEEGMYVIALVNKKSSELFIRARISIISAHGFCYVWDVDNCGYIMARSQDIFHIHGKFTMRHPQAVTIVCRGTEQYLLTKKFENLISDAFKNVNVNVKVSDINRPHPLLRVPVARIRINDQKGEDLLDFLRSHTPGLQNFFLPLTFLSREQESLLSKLEHIGHIVPALS